MTENSDITQLISQWQAGDEAALEQLAPFVYSELKRLARSYMNRERVNHTLQATALVNEAFLQLAGTDADFESRSHFMVVAARMMRRTLVDHARALHSQKRGGGERPATLHEDAVGGAERSDELLELDLALDRLAGHDQQLASTVELVYFGGLTYDEAAEHLGRSRSSVYNDLQFAKAWLRREIG
ncbi:MAG: ECF-type sigma factor [Pseudomonadota bacterium]